MKLKCHVCENLMYSNRRQTGPKQQLLYHLSFGEVATGGMRRRKPKQ